MTPRILSLNSRFDLIRQLKDIKVDQYGINIMVPKADSYLIKIPRVSSIAANILKQEMLSLGGDVAISRNSITGKDKYTDCVVIGNFTQLDRLIKKLRMQPFKLDEIGANIRKILENYRKDNFLIKCRKHILKTVHKTLIMGIINVTTDSFSGDGLLNKKSNEIDIKNLQDVVSEKTEKMIQEGADIIDIGAESSRPGAKPIGTREEIKRISLCLKVLAKKIKIPISVDTYKPEVAEAALDLGACIINDITGLKNPIMKKLIAKYGAGVVIMHMKGMPRTMQRNPEYKTVMDDVISFLKGSIESAVDFGIPQESIIIDPGIGFGKTLEHNLEIIRKLREFKALGRPILIGLSRKSFIGKLLEAEVDKRIFGTAAAVAISIKEGADILRVHDLRQMRDVVRISDALVKVKT